MMGVGEGFIIKEKRNEYQWEGGFIQTKIRNFYITSIERKIGGESERERVLLP